MLRSLPTLPSGWASVPSALSGPCPETIARRPTMRTIENGSTTPGGAWSGFGSTRPRAASLASMRAMAFSSRSDGTVDSDKIERPELKGPSPCPASGSTASPSPPTATAPARRRASSNRSASAARRCTTGVDDEFAAAGIAGLGAWILGRNMFGPVRGPWPDDKWKGWWGPNPPYHVPVFVLTHHPRAPIEMEGGTTFHFVTDGIHAALERARA